MTGTKIVNTTPVEITKRISIEVDCPKQDCDHKFDVSSFDWGLSMECPKCKNITYNPAYDKKKYNRKQFYGGIFLSFIVGLLSSYLGSYLLQLFSSNTQ